MSQPGNPTAQRGRLTVSDLGPRMLAKGLPKHGPSRYARWLRSTSYVQALPDVDAFVTASLDDLAQEFPDGEIVEPFVARLWRFTR